VTTTEHPRPALTGESAPFWQHVRDGVLHVQACGACGALRHPPRPRCARCHSADRRWTPVSGRGEVWSVTVCHPPVLAAYAERVPYNAVVVRLAEGPFLVSNLVGVPLDELEVGMAVEVEIVPLDDEVSLPRFRRAVS
jgi:uncharacterized OB-fold protein